MQIKGDNKAKGRRGESAAAKYLKQNGYRIAERNYRNPFGEVDIIAEKEGVTAFIEVKCRTSDLFGAPNEAVNYARRARYINAARFYFSGREMDCVVRFDIIEVTSNGINHIISAFEGE